MTDAPITRTVPLDTPVERGEQRFDALQIRKPRSGELRGLNMADVVQLNVGAVSKLLPRITTPALTAQEVADLDPADFLAISAEIADFLVQKRARQDFPAS